MPKSSSFDPLAVRNVEVLDEEKLSGLRSRWTMPLSCAAASALHTPRNSAAASPSAMRPAHLDPARERHALEQLHHDVGESGLEVAEVEDLDDAGVFDRGRCLRLTEEPIDDLAVAGQLWEQHLHRGQAADQRVLRAIDAAHATIRDLVQDPIVAGGGADEPVGHLGMIAVATPSVKPDILGIVRSLICIAMGLAACQAATSSTEQPLLTPAAGILLTNGTSTFNATQVGQTSNTLTFAVHTSVNNSSITINSFSYSCPDYTITATLPGYADRTCESTCATGGGTTGTQPIVCPVGQICTDDDYYFTAVFHPSVAASTSCVVTANTTNGAPTLTLYGTGTPPPIHVTAGPGSINFGGVRVNTASTGVGVTITNSGGSAATINSVTASAGFTVAGNTGSHGLGAGASEGVTVTCHPTATGPLNGNVNISSNDPTNSSINIGLTCSGIDSALAIAPSPAVLPTIRTGDSESQIITVTNTGAAATSIQNVMVTGFDMVSAPAPGTMLAANGGQATVTVSYSPTTKGDVAGMLHIDYDNGKAIDTPIAAKAVTTSLSLTPDGNVELGPICIGQTHSQEFSLIAADEGSFKLTSVTMPDATAGFTLTAPTLPATVQGSAANTVKLMLAAAPAIEGDLNSSFVLTTDIPMATPHTINLHMLGLSAGVNGPPMVDLGGNLINQTSLGQHVQISNCTDSPVTITSVNISGTDATDFAVVDQPMDLTIMPAQSIQWLVVLDPHSGGDKSAQFNAIYDGGTTVVPLIGEGLTDMLPGQDAGSAKSSYYACNVGSPSALFPIGLALGGLLVRRRRRPHGHV